VQRDQSVSEMAQEILLARRAMALVQRSEEPLIEALEDILLKTPAGSRPLKPMGAPDQEEEPLLFPSFGYYLDESDPTSSCSGARTAPTWPPSAPKGPGGKASSKPPERTTRRWSRRMRAIWPCPTKSATAPERRTLPIHRSAWKGNSATFVIDEVRVAYFLRFASRRGVRDEGDRGWLG
jgi:hypothetical protein